MALAGCNIALAGSFSRPRSETIEIMERNGGKFTLNVTRATTHLLCTKDELDKFSSRVMLAVKYNVPIVSEAWVTDSVSDGQRRDESNYLLQVDAVGLEKKLKHDSDFMKEKKKANKRAASRSPSPMNEEDFEEDTPDEEHALALYSPTSPSKKSKRQRIPKDFGDVEVPKPRKRRSKGNEESDFDSDDVNLEGNGNSQQDVKSMKKDIQFLKKELQAMRNDVNEVLQVLHSLVEKKSKRRKSRESAAIEEAA